MRGSMMCPRLSKSSAQERIENLFIRLIDGEPGGKVGCHREDCGEVSGPSSDDR
jgi:hypothetical protein